MEKISIEAKTKNSNKTSTKLLALPMGDYDDPIVYQKFTLSEHYFRKVEQAGQAYENYLTRKLNPCYDTIFSDGDDDDNEIVEDDVIYEWEKEYRKIQHDHKSAVDSKEGSQNFYMLLGLEDEFINATTDSIRKAYKKLAQTNHPDKKQTDDPKEKEEINSHWLKIKEAYDTLTDPEKRAKYDSTFEFNDKIPDDNVEFKSDYDFFLTYGPIFLSNSIWSKRKPVPKIGDMATDLKKVKKFYNFWFSFDSWRDFSVDGEYDLDEAQCRWEKRQMLKENKKMKSTAQKDERSRIIRLVQNAYKNDPRIKAEQDRLQKEREDAKIERLEMQKKLKKEKEERDKRLKEEFELRQKKKAEERIRLKEELIEKYLEFSKTLGFNFNRDEVFQIKFSAEIEKIQDIFEEVGKENDKEPKTKAFIYHSNKNLGLKLRDEKRENSIWTKEEIYALQKATKKFPAGTQSRWEKIADLVKTKGNEQIIQMAHFLQTNPSIKLVGDTFDLRVLIKNITNGNSNGSTTVTENPSTDKEKSEDKWDTNQQKALEEALRKYPSSMPANERWSKIASEVPNKNKKQCVERFKYISKMVKSQQK